MSQMKQFFYIVPINEGEQPMSLEEYRGYIKGKNPETTATDDMINQMHNTYYQLCVNHGCGNFYLERFISNDEGLDIAFAQIKEEEPKAILLDTI